MNDLILILQQVKANWGIETVNAIKTKIQQEQIIWNGELLDSINYVQDETLDGNITFKMTEYGKFIDEGVNGLNNSVGSQYSYRGNVAGMGAALKPWADSKGLNPWAVAWTLQKEGLQPRRFFNDVIAVRLESLAKDLEKAYVTYLNSTINKQQNP
jgi:hypothetical protein